MWDGLGASKLVHYEGGSCSLGGHVVVVGCHLELAGKDWVRLRGDSVHWSIRCHLEWLGCSGCCVLVAGGDWDNGWSMMDAMSSANTSRSRQNRFASGVAERTVRGGFCCKRGHSSW